MGAIDLPAEGPVFIAHRAGNSPGTLQRAEEAGTDVVEADVFLYRGRLEIRHSKTMGPVPLLWDRWSLERGWGSRFLIEDLLDELSPETTLMLDMKRDAPGLSAAIGVTMRTREREYLVCSQAWTAVEPFIDEPLARPVFSVGSERALSLFLERFPEGSGVWCSIHERLLTAEVCEALMARTEFVMSWPVNRRSRMEELLGLGVRGMITDRLELVLEGRG